MLPGADKNFGRGQHQANAGSVSLVRIVERVGPIENQACPLQFREIDCRGVPLSKVHRAHQS